MIKKKYRFLFLLPLAIVGSCVINKTKDIQESQLQIIDRYIYVDCNLYCFKPKNNNYVLKFGLSGACDSLNAENYLSTYKDLLTGYKDSLKNGYILVEFYEELQIDSTFYLNLKKITSDACISYNVAIKEQDKEKCLLVLNHK